MTTGAWATVGFGPAFAAVVAVAERAAILGGLALVTLEVNERNVSGAIGEAIFLIADAATLGAADAQAARALLADNVDRVRGARAVLDGAGELNAAELARVLRGSSARPDPDFIASSERVALRSDSVSATAGGDLGLVDFEARLSSQQAFNSLGLSDDQADAILEPVFRGRRDDVAVDLRDDYDRVQGELFNDPEVAPSYEQFADSAFSPALRDDLKSFSSACATTNNSFAGDTLVAMADGSMTPIVQVLVGDEVLAYDFDAGVTVSRMVTATLPHTDWLLEAHFSDGSVMSVTEDHRFWSATDTAWVELQDLDPTDILLTPDGATVAVDWLDWDAGVTAPAWDLTIAEEHNFFVAADGSAVPLLVHNQTSGFFCGVGVDAEYVRNLRPLSEALEGSNLAAKASDDVVDLFADLSDVEQVRFLDSLAALQANVVDDVDLARRASRMIENAAISPNHTKELLEATAVDRAQLEIHLDQIRRNGNDKAEQAVFSAESGSPFGQPRDPETVPPSERRQAEAEGFVGSYYASLGSVSEHLDETVSVAKRDEIFRDIHGARQPNVGDNPPQTGLRPDLLVDGEFRDVFTPNASDPFNAVGNGLQNKLSRGQTQRLDIVVDSSEGAPNRLTLSQMQAGWDENVARFDSGLQGLLDEITYVRPTDGRVFLPQEVVVIDIATNDQRVLYRGL